LFPCKLLEKLTDFNETFSQYIGKTVFLYVGK